MIIPLGHAHVAHFFSGAGLPYGAAVTYGTSLNGSMTPTELAVELHDNLGDNIVPHLNNQVTLTETRVKFGPNISGPFASTGTPRVGGVSGAMSPPNVCYLVEKNTALGGRANRGRMYLPGVTETYVNNDGTLISGAVSDIQAGLDVFLGRIDTFLIDMEILHNASSDPTDVTSLTLDPRAATQRRRLRR